MDNSIYSNAATSPNTYVALSNAVREFTSSIYTQSLIDLKVLNAMKERRNNRTLSVRIREQYVTTVANMQSIYNNTYGA